MVLHMYLQAPARRFDADVKEEKELRSWQRCRRGRFPRRDSGSAGERRGPKPIFHRTPFPMYVCVANNVAEKSNALDLG